ncbi:MAG: hypothetical protein PHY34_00450 [Patescibacteria group bacterium]|nr:hypothetical protein [Patescibacteria group bacterium]MDD5715900.1 hypothetical protein [Patescibacteria group bacterium]
MHKIITMLVVVFIAVSLFVGCSNKEEELNNQITALTVKNNRLEADTTRMSSVIQQTDEVIQGAITVADSIGKENAKLQEHVAFACTEVQTLKAEVTSLTAERDALTCQAIERDSAYQEMKATFDTTIAAVMAENGHLTNLLAAAKTHADSLTILVNYYYLCSHRGFLSFLSRGPQSPGFSPQDLGVPILKKKEYNAALDQFGK